MAAYTEHYQLHQWEAGDDFLRTDFNEDFAKIDEAIGATAVAVPKVAVGTYTGNGSTAEATVVTVGFAPKMVFVWADQGGYSDTYKPIYCGMAVQGQILQQSMLTLTATGFRVVNRLYNGYSYYPMLNANLTYFYFAIG